MDTDFSEKKINTLKNQTPFFVFSPKRLLHNIKIYKDNFPPNTALYYALKANSEKIVLETINNAGIGFEVASKYELALLKRINVTANKIIYGTAVKPISHIKYFVKYGVDRFAFDCEDELYKIAKCMPNARVYVRVLVDDKSDSVFKMSKKFGISLNSGINLMIKAKKLGLTPYGISFNVGSQAKNKYAWARGITAIAKSMKTLQSKGIKIEILNIGGGFPHNYNQDTDIPTIKQIAKHIKIAIKKIPYKVNYIAEPGRGLVANAYVLVTSIFGKIDRESGQWLYIDAGTYNAMLEAMSHQGNIKYKIVSLGEHSTKEHSHILTGPTGDNLDIIHDNILLPSSLNIGDKLIIYDVGAYSFTLMTRFNGFPKPKVVTI